MSTTEITDVLVLVAVDRAFRHRADGEPRAAPVWAICEHLGVSGRSRAGRCVRVAARCFGRLGLSRGRRPGSRRGSCRRPASVVFRGYAQRQGPRAAESPQHRAWREARALAEQRIEGFWTALLDDVKRSHGLLGSRVPGEQPSDVWFELGEWLHQACRRLASATYCLGEWLEPDDARADVDDHRDLGDRPGTRSRSRVRVMPAVPAPAHARVREQTR